MTTNTAININQVAEDDVMSFAFFTETHAFERLHPDVAFELTDIAIQNAIALRDDGEEWIHVQWDTYPDGSLDYYNDVLALYATTIKDT